MQLKARQNWNASVSAARALHDSNMVISDTTGTLKGKVSGHVRFWYEF
jgi:hypothetical protein